MNKKKKLVKKKKTVKKGKVKEKDKLKKIVTMLDDKKAEDIRVLDVNKASDIWDYFVVCSGTSDVHIKTLHDYLDSELKKQGEKILYRDKGLDNKWIIVDYGDVLVHIFDGETRKYYAIEKMWGEKEEKPSGLIKKKVGNEKRRKKRNRIK